MITTTDALISVTLISHSSSALLKKMATARLMISAADKLKVQNTLSLVLSKPLSWSQQNVLKSIGIHSKGNETKAMDLSGLDDSLMFQLRRELRNLMTEDATASTLLSSSDSAGESCKSDDYIAISRRKALHQAMIKLRFANSLLNASDAGKATLSHSVKVVEEKPKEELVLKELDLNKGKVTKPLEKSGLIKAKKTPLTKLGLMRKKFDYFDQQRLLN